MTDEEYKEKIEDIFQKVEKVLDKYSSLNIIIFIKQDIQALKESLQTTRPIPE